MSRSIAVGIILAAFLMVMPPLFLGHHSLRDIGAPCHHHGGVRQFIPEQVGVWHYEPATVVCMDGKVGRV